MKLVLTQDEVSKVIWTAFVDGGLSELGGAGIEFDYKEADYKAARAKLKNPCREDVWLQILKDGNALAFKELEENKQPVTHLTLAMATKNLKNPKAISYIVDILDEEGNHDAITCYNVLQFALFKGIKELKYV